MDAVTEAADVYLADPTTRTHQIGLFSLDLAVTVAADDNACRLLADPQIDREERRRIVRTVLLRALLQRRPLYP